MKDQSFGIIPLLQRNQSVLFLLVQHQAGHWGFPKGHAELDETAIQAACRELEEETGISVYQLIDAPPFSESYGFIKKDQIIKKTVTYFLAIVQSAEVHFQRKEIRAYAWLPFEEASERISFLQSKQLLDQVRQYLLQSSSSGLNLTSK